MADVLYFAKHFVPLHRRMCLALVKIAKFQLRVYIGGTDGRSYKWTAHLCV